MSEKLKVESGFEQGVTYKGNGNPAASTLYWTIANRSETIGAEMAEYVEETISDAAYPADYTKLLGQLTRMEAQISELSKNAGGSPLDAWPIGSYYWSDNATSPQEIFGGKWVQVKDKFVYAAGSKVANTTGGEETHTLVTSETPSHSHGMQSHTHQVSLSGSASHSHTPSDTSKSFVVQASGGTLSHSKVSSGSSTAYNYLNVGQSNQLLSHSASTSTATVSISISGNTGGPSAGDTSATGGGGAHNNMPPYVVAYCWKRVE